MYKDADALVEKSCKLIVSIAMKVLFQALMVPMFFACYLAYYTTDAGRDAFQLPFPYWWELQNKQFLIIFFMFCQSDH